MYSHLIVTFIYFVFIRPVKYNNENISHWHVSNRYILEPNVGTYLYTSYLHYIILFKNMTKSFVAKKNFENILENLFSLVFIVQSFEIRQNNEHF